MPFDDEQAERDDWRSNRKLVLAEMRRLSNNIEGLTSSVNKDLTEMKIEMATMKTKVVLIGTMAAIVITPIVAAIVNVIFKRL